ncbi:helix-turn-helix transcriptional regulator [Rhizobium herbae]|nr:helix-turn-helix transcriptional regulator [Rhizobium herbae]
MAINYPPEILRAGRALVGWKQSQLAQAAGVSRHTLLRVEEGQNVMLETLTSVVRALEDQGVEFTGATTAYGVGVRWRTPSGRTGEDPAEVDVPKKG